MPASASRLMGPGAGIRPEGPFPWLAGLPPSYWAAGGYESCCFTGERYMVDRIVRLYIQQQQRTITLFEPNTRVAVSSQVLVDPYPRPSAAELKRLEQRVECKCSSPMPDRSGCCCRCGHVVAGYWRRWID